MLEQFHELLLFYSMWADWEPIELPLICDQRFTSRRCMESGPSSNMLCNTYICPRLFSASSFSTLCVLSILFWQRMVVTIKRFDHVWDNSVNIPREQPVRGPLSHFSFIVFTLRPVSCNHESLTHESHPLDTSQFYLIQSILAGILTVWNKHCH